MCLLPFQLFIQRRLHAPNPLPANASSNRKTPAEIPLEFRSTITKDQGGSETQDLNKTIARSNVTFLQCVSPSPRAVFFIRIPKCASTSFVDVLRKLSKKSGAFDVFFHPSGAYDWDRDTMRQVAGQVQSSIPRNKGFVYARHFYHVDFHKFGMMNYTYLTIIRDPVARVVSSYLYYHFSSKPHIRAMLDPSHRGETLETCLQHEHEGCTSNLMTKYFCGHARFCKLGDRQALEVAKHNLRTQFAAVGIMEEMELSLRLFKAVLPDYFRTLDVSLLSVLNKNEHSLEVGPVTREVIAAANKADLELYSFAYEILRRKVSVCGVER